MDIPHAQSALNICFQEKLSYPLLMRNSIFRDLLSTRLYRKLAVSNYVLLPFSLIFISLAYRRGYERDGSRAFKAAPDFGQLDRLNRFSSQCPPGVS
jgi:hypothetical protein